MRIVFIMVLIANVSFAGDSDGKAIESSRVDPKSLRLALPRRVSQKITRPAPGSPSNDPADIFEPAANPGDSAHDSEQAPATHEISLKDEADNVPGGVSPGSTPGRFTPRDLKDFLLRKLHLKRQNSQTKVQGESAESTDESKH